MRTTMLIARSAVLSRHGLLIVVLLGVTWQGCLILPTYRVHHAPRGTLEIVDAQTKAPIESALLLLLTTREKGGMESVERFKWSLTDAYVYRPNERNLIYKGRGIGFLFLIVPHVNATYTEALVLVAPGYAPKYLVSRKEKLRKDEKLTWMLRPVEKADSDIILEELRSRLSGKVLGRSVQQKWDTGYWFDSEEELPWDSSSIYPYKEYPIKLSDQNRQVAIAYLDAAIKDMEAK